MKASIIIRWVQLMILAGAGMACTNQTPHSFQFIPVTDNFTAATEINTKVDILWMVDNSASMDTHQDVLRRGFQAFAAKYMKPTWDIRLATITSDTYLAHPAFTNYLNSSISGSVGWSSSYINSRLSTWVNPSWNSNLLNTKTGVFTQGIRMKDMVPAYGPNYAKLLPGIHDGPIGALCSEAHPYFFYAASQCKIRDDQTKYSGPSHCLNPGTGETAITQCVNTVENDTIHSGQAVISTAPPAGTPGDATWVNQITQSFMINASVGTAGSGSERGLGSVLQLLSDNETGPTPFFRPGSVRVIVFLSDEDDQTQQLPSNPAAGFGPFTGYTSNCSPKTVDGYTYTISSCPDPTQLTPVASVKSQLDTFFSNLDGDPKAQPNYLVVPIVALTGASIQALQQARRADDIAATGTTNVAVDRGDRYLALMNLVGQGSFAADIGSSDYSQVLDNLGTTIAQRRSIYTLSRTPGAMEDLQVTIIHADGTSSVIPPTSYTVVGTTLSITDLNLILSFTSGDHIQVYYQPKSVT